MVVGGMAAFGLLLFAAFELGPFGSPSVTPLGSKSGLPRGRPGQGIARANALHRAHVATAIPCDRCHKVDDAERIASAHRCLGCHEDRPARIHAGIADLSARECVSCHDFLHLPKASLGVWGCPTCHVRADSADAPTRTPEGPEVVIHSEAFCGDCHAPHGDVGLQPKACTECHEDRSTDHGPAGAPIAQRCLACHSAHRPAAQQKAPCADCHRSRIDASTALFDGHDRCQGCHPPHGFTKRTAKACGDCHADRVGATAAARKHHRDCTDCHDPHAPVRRVRERCAACHDEQKTSHPRDERGACLGCHPVHQSKGAAVVSIARCTSCHRNARSDSSFHNGAGCRDCHRPHGKLVGDGRAAFCLGCHSKRVGKAPAIATSSGHALCNKCHIRAAHDTSKKPSTCTVCHKSEKRDNAAGHRDCSKCHETHSGAIRERAQCTSCHDRAKIEGHGKSGYARCTACHRPHDGRTKKK